MTVAPEPTAKHRAQAHVLAGRLAREVTNALAALYAQVEAQHHELVSARAAAEHAIEHAKRIEARLDGMRAENARLRDELHRERYAPEHVA
jgi:hypothetical protein